MGKPRKRAPWGDLLGKPIERLFPRNDHLGEVSERDAMAQQFKKMCRLKDRYGIEGDRGWEPWYQLALALATEIDDAVTIIDPLPRPSGKTAPRWRGAEGLQLLAEVQALSEEYEGKVKQYAIFAELQELCPQRYGKMSLDQLKTNYHEAKRHHANSTKRKAD